MRRTKNIVTENTNIFMSGHSVRANQTLINGIVRIEVFSSHYINDTTFSKPTLLTRLKTALNS